MGNVVFSNDFVSINSTSVTGRNASTSYPAINVTDNWHLKRCFRSTDSTGDANNPLLIFDMGSAKTVEAVMLNNVNFNTVKIMGSSANLSTDWSTCANGSNVAIGQDEIVGRYKAYIPTTSGFNYQYLAVVVPATASLVDSGGSTAVLEVGTVLKGYQTYADGEAQLALDIEREL